MTDPVVRAGGKIYRYVGDEMVVTWKASVGIRNMNCLRALYESRQVIERNREKYLTNYGYFPQFSAGFHTGVVVTGQLGDVKSQIVMSGSALYEGHLIEKSCNTMNADHLISEPLMKQLELPGFYQEKYVGQIQTDASGSLKLFTVRTLDETA